MERKLKLLCFGVAAIAALTIGSMTTLAAFSRTKEVNKDIDVVGSWGTTLFLNPKGIDSGDGWTADGALMYMYSFVNATTNNWTKGVKYKNTDIYYFPYPSYSKIIFVRINPAAEAPSFDKDVKWNQTLDLDRPATNGNNLFTITSWEGEEGKKSGGSWSKYTAN